MNEVLPVNLNLVLLCPKTLQWWSVRRKSFNLPNQPLLCLVSQVVDTVHTNAKYSPPILYKIFGTIMYEEQSFSLSAVGVGQ